MTTKINNIMSNIFEETLSRVPEYSKLFVQNSFDIVDKIMFILNEKKINQKELATLLGKSESEISKILTPNYNMTFKTLAKIEAALEEKIINIPRPDKDFHKMAIPDDELDACYYDKETPSEVKSKIPTNSNWTINRASNITQEKRKFYDNRSC